MNEQELKKKLEEYNEAHEHLKKNRKRAWSKRKSNSHLRSPNTRYRNKNRKHKKTNYS